MPRPIPHTHIWMYLGNGEFELVDFDLPNHQAVRIVNQRKRWDPSAVFVLTVGDDAAPQPPTG